MSVLLTRLVWYQIDESESEDGSIAYLEPVDLTDAVDMNAGKGLDIKNNTLTFTLRNDWEKYVDSLTSKIKFSEDDQIIAYAKYVEDADDITAAWTVDSTTYPTSTDLLGYYYIKSLGAQHNSSGRRIKLTCVDKTYILFNKVFSKGWTAADGYNAPELIQKIIRYTTQGTGPFQAGGVNYEIDARLVSDGGEITDERSEDPTTFPDKGIAKVWKPVYEWIRELSSVDAVNSDTEIANQTYVYGKPFIFWVDEESVFHWIAPSEVVANTIVVGTDDVFNVNLTKKVFGSVNMIIYNAGTDLKGNGIWSYYLDEGSNIKGLQMRVIPMTHIARDLLAGDYGIDYNPPADRVDGGDGAGYPVPQYPSNFPLSACFFTHAGLDTYDSPGDITDESDYNDALREASFYEADKISRRITAGLSTAKWTGSIEVKGAKYTPGALVSFTDTSIGLNAEELRLMDIQHNITSEGWFTTMKLEKDPGTLINV